MAKVESNYRYDLSHRQNRHLYEGGMYLKEGFAFTQGNVISNAGQNGAGIDLSFISHHEELHIWQNRLFGPLFQATYVVWAVGGFIVANIVWLTDTDQDWGRLVETAAYYDNPFEYWAYQNDSNWPPSGADPSLNQTIEDWYTVAVPPILTFPHAGLTGGGKEI